MKEKMYRWFKCDGCSFSCILCTRLSDLDPVACLLGGDRAGWKPDPAMHEGAVVVAPGNAVFHGCKGCPGRCFVLSEREPVACPFAKNFQEARWGPPGKQVEG